MSSRTVSAGFVRYLIPQGGQLFRCVGEIIMNSPTAARGGVEPFAEAQTAVSWRTNANNSVTGWGRRGPV